VFLNVGNSQSYQRFNKEHLGLAIRCEYVSRF